MEIEKARTTWTTKWTTNDEVKFLSGLGSWREAIATPKHTPPDYARRVAMYLGAMRYRTEWDIINPHIVRLAARRRLRLGRPIFKEGA